VIYICFRDRNAWRGARSTTYMRSRSIHTTLRSAQRSVGSSWGPHRSQGTAWFIEEYPALALYSTRRTLVVTEVNSEDPLRGFRVKRFSNLQRANSPAKYTSAATLRASLKEVYSALTWETDNLIAASAHSDVAFVHLPKRRLRRWSARPRGWLQDFKWIQDRHNLKRKAVLSLARAFEQRGLTVASTPTRGRAARAGEARR
jgi:hypothetical protein